MVKRAARTLSALVLAVAAQTATAEEVRVFTKPPSAEEMGQLVVPGQSRP